MCYKRYSAHRVSRVDPEPEEDVREAILAAVAPEVDARSGWAAAALREAADDAVPDGGAPPL